MTKLYKMINYTGIAAFIFLVIALISVILGLGFKFHKLGGMLAFIFASMHVGLIIYRNIKLKAPSR
ncbi:MAG: hypothetical protein NTZ48_03170 [Candidatus Omnitrophica bacterium]|nr:hypothetical protein [Candidatus Omnitrophota bacterium]